MKSRYILRLDSFEGRDTFLRCGSDDDEFLYCIVLLDDSGKAEVVDSGYRSFEEAAAAWPECVTGS